VAAACRDSGRDFFVLAFEGSADRKSLGDAPIMWIRMSGLSRALDSAREQGAEELVMVGKIPRPSVLELMRDPRSAKFLAKVGTRMLGDDNILSAVVREIEQSEGFRVIGPEEILADILAPEGPYGAIFPNENEMADIRRGMEVLQTIGPMDIGQGLVVQNGTILGVEAAEGTDRLIARCAEFIDPQMPGGVFVKASKPSQERRIDLPAVGSSTVEHAVQAGLRGIAVEAGGALVLDRLAMIEVADNGNLFLLGVPVEI
jgi:DUF1009 family protein